MTLWQRLALGAVLAVVVGVAMTCRLRWLAREVEKVERLIKPARPVFVGHDESLAVRAEQRRVIAAERRRQAARIDSGQPGEPRIRIVGSR